MLAFGYVRVSSIEQEHGYGPDIQERSIRGYAASKHLPEPQLVHESASAESLAARPVLQRLLADAKGSMLAGMETHIIVHRLDRLARNLTDQEAVVGAALRYGYRLHSTDESEAQTLDPAYAGDPIRTAIRQVMGAFAQLERATIQGRLDAGSAEKARRGGFTGARPPFGYRVHQGELQIDPELVPIIRHAFQLLDEGKTLAWAADVLATTYGRCFEWKAMNVLRLREKRSLYAEGLYKSRAGVAPVVRPDLVILPASGTRALKPAPQGPVDWSHQPDPIALTSVEMLLNRSAAWLKALVSERRLAVVWRKGKLYLPRASAEALEAIARPPSGDRRPDVPTDAHAGEVKTGT